MESLQNRLRKILVFMVLLFSADTFAQAPVDSLWKAIDTKEVTGGINSMYIDSFQDEVVLLGWFQTDSLLYRMAIWDGTHISLTHSPQNQGVFVVTRFQGDLYADAYTGGLWKMDNAHWVPVDTGNSPSPNFPHFIGLGEYNGHLVVGSTGSHIFTGTSINCFAAQWDGQQFSSLYGLDTLPFGQADAWVYAIAEYKDQLYLAGNFELGDSLSEIIRWDGQSWRSVGGGIDPWNAQGGSLVTGMTVYNNELIVYGEFSKAAGSPGENVAAWDGQKWHELDEGLIAQRIPNMAVHDGYLYAAQIYGVRYGYYNPYGNDIFRWDGYKWCSMGTYHDQLEGTFTTLGVFRDTLLAGGPFVRINEDTTYQFLAQWIGGTYSDTCYEPVGNGIAPWPEAQKNGLNLYPNPVQQTAMLEFSVAQKNRALIVVRNVLGSIVIRTSQLVYPGMNKLLLDMGSLGSGMYFVTLTTNSGLYQGKLLKE